MFSGIRRSAKKAGHPPGTAIYTGARKNKTTKISVVTYNKDEVRDQEGVSFEDINAFLANKLEVTWINVEGLQNVALIQSISDRFNLHPLTVEDILNVAQRPKVEEFDDYLFVTLKVLRWRPISSTFIVKQLSLILGKDFLLSFEEFDANRFNDIREKLNDVSKQRLREQGCDYLAYRLIDAVVDEYFVVLEALGDRIEKVEERIIADPTPRNSRTIYKLKRQMLLLRKTIWPMREAISHLLHVEERLISKFTRIYLRDVYDHAMQAIDTLETFRDMLSGMLDMYLSSLTNRMNEIMKTLTIITTIFIPITAIASIYGMNFPNLPGLQSEWGYIIALLSMFIMGVGMIIYFYKKHWIDWR